MLSFRLVDPTPLCLASLFGQASLKGISKLICPKQKFRFPALITKRYISVYPPSPLLSKWQYRLLICSSQKLAILDEFASLYMFKRSASPGVSFQETYLIHPLLSTSNDTILVQDNIISCLHYLMAPLTLLSFLSTLQPEWSFKSINYIMSSLLIFSSASHH